VADRAAEIWCVLQFDSHRLELTAVASATLTAHLTLLRLAIYVVMAALVVQAVLSSINPSSSFATLLDAVTRPLLRPLRRWILPMANVDLSPPFVLIACQLQITYPAPLCICFELQQQRLVLTVQVQSNAKSATVAGRPMALP